MKYTTNDIIHIQAQGILHMSYVGFSFSCPITVFHEVFCLLHSILNSTFFKHRRHIESTGMSFNTRHQAKAATLFKDLGVRVL